MIKRNLNTNQNEFSKMTKMMKFSNNEHCLTFYKGDNVIFHKCYQQLKIVRNYKSIINIKMIKKGVDAKNYDKPSAFLTSTIGFGTSCKLSLIASKIIASMRSSITAIATPSMNTELILASLIKTGPVL